MARTKGESDKGRPVEVIEGDFNAYAALEALMTAPDTPILSPRAEARLLDLGKECALTPEQMRRAAIQLSLSEDLGIYEQTEGAISLNDDAAALTLLTWREKKIAEEAERKARERGEKGKDIYKSGRASNQEKAIYRRIVFSGGKINEASLTDEQKALVSSGLTLYQKAAGLAGGKDAEHRLKLVLGEILSEQSRVYGNLATLGGVPPEILRRDFGVVLGGEVDKEGNTRPDRAIVVDIRDICRRILGRPKGAHLSDKERRRAFDTLYNANRLYYWSPDFQKYTQVVRSIDISRAKGCLIITLSPDFATDAITIKGAQSPRDFVALPVGAILNIGQVGNALQDLCIYRTNQSGIAKISAKDLYDYILERCETIGKHTDRIPKEIDRAIEDINQAGLYEISKGEEKGKKGSYYIIRQIDKTPKSPKSKK